MQGTDFGEDAVRAGEAGTTTTAEDDTPRHSILREAQQQAREALEDLYGTDRAGEDTISADEETSHHESIVDPSKTSKTHGKTISEKDLPPHIKVAVEKHKQLLRFMPIELLSSRTDKLMHQYELSSRYVHKSQVVRRRRHILVTTAAILSFIAASDVKTQANTAVILSLTAGIIGFVVTFITTMDRYCNWKSKSDVDKSTAMIYGKIKQDIDLEIVRLHSRMEDAADGPEMVKKFEEQIKNIEDLSGEHLIPTQIHMAFQGIEAKMRLAIDNYNIVSSRLPRGGHISQGLEPEPPRVTFSNSFIPNETERVDDRKYRQILAIAFMKAVEKITTYRGCCIWRRWPLFLPDAKDLVEDVFKELEKELAPRENPDAPSGTDFLSLDVRVAI